MTTQPKRRSKSRISTKLRHSCPRRSSARCRTTMVSCSSAKRYHRRQQYVCNQVTSGRVDIFTSEWHPMSKPLNCAVGIRVVSFQESNLGRLLKHMFGPSNPPITAAPSGNASVSNSSAQADYALEKSWTYYRDS